MKMSILDLLHIRNIVLNGLKLMPAGEDTITSTACMTNGTTLIIPRNKRSVLFSIQQSNLVWYEKFENNFSG